MRTQCTSLIGYSFELSAFALTCNETILDCNLFLCFWLFYAKFYEIIFWLKLSQNVNDGANFYTVNS